MLLVQVFHNERSSVWECVHRATKQHYCVKILNGGYAAHQHETRMLQKAQALKNDHVVQLHETFPAAKRTYLVMEHLDRGNLLSYVVQHDRLNERQIRTVVRQVLRALQALHTQLTHNDVCPANVLLRSTSATATTSKAKLADFGLARTWPSSKPQLLPAAWYRAPERTASPAADMWSVGALVLFCWHGHSDFDVRQSYVGLSRPCKQFLTQILSVDPEVRLTATEALEHPWLTGPRQTISPAEARQETPVIVREQRARWRTLLGCFGGSRPNHVDKHTATDTSTIGSIG